MLDALRQYQLQGMEVETLRNELREVRSSYDHERENLSHLLTRVRVKERTRQDLGGLTDTVVQGRRAGGGVGGGGALGGGARRGGRAGPPEVSTFL